MTSKHFLGTLTFASIGLISLALINGAKAESGDGPSVISPAVYPADVSDTETPRGDKTGSIAATSAKPVIALGRKDAVKPTDSAEGAVLAEKSGSRLRLRVADAFAQMH